MELRQLEHFVAVAQEGSFTHGARRVRVAQSAVSATIRKLERELGMPLFTRDANTTVLTEAGIALLPEAQALLSGARRARDTVEQVRGGLRGTVRIGTLVSHGGRPETAGGLVVDLPAVLGRFHVTHPHVSFQLRSAPQGSAGHLAGVAAGDLDLALVAAAGVARQVRFEAADQATALGLVRHGVGVTLLPRVGSEGYGVAVVDIVDADLNMPIALATPTDRPPTAAASAITEHILRAAKRPAAR